MKLALAVEAAAAASATPAAGEVRSSRTASSIELRVDTALEPQRREP
jgi:hypothetical protein